MTLEELKNKKVTITVNKTLTLGKDILETFLSNMLEEQKEENYSDEELLEAIKNRCYCKDDLDDILGFIDYKITIHD